MCNEVVAQSSYALRYVPDYLKTQEMCKEAISNKPAVLFLVPDHFKKHDMCIEGLEVDTWSLYDIPHYLKTQKMCNEGVEANPSSMQFVPDWFVSQQQLDLWYDDGITMMILLNAVKVIENERLKKQKLRKNSCLLLGIHQDIRIGVCQKMKNKRQKKNFFLTT